MFSRPKAFTSSSDFIKLLTIPIKYLLMCVHHEKLLCICVWQYEAISKPGLSHFYNWQYFQHNMYVIFVVKKYSNDISDMVFFSSGNLRAWTSNDIKFLLFRKRIFSNYMMQNKFLCVGCLLSFVKTTNLFQ